MIFEILGPPGAAHIFHCNGQDRGHDPIVGLIKFEYTDMVLACLGLAMKGHRFEKKLTESACFSADYKKGLRTHVCY